MEIEPRVMALERDLALVKAEQIHIRSACASKEDLFNVKLELKADIHQVHSALHTATWRIIGFNVGFSTLIVSAVYFMVSATH